MFDRITDEKPTTRYVKPAKANHLTTEQNYFTFYLLGLIEIEIFIGMNHSHRHTRDCKYRNRVRALLVSGRHTNAINNFLFHTKLMIFPHFPQFHCVSYMSWYYLYMKQWAAVHFNYILSCCFVRVWCHPKYRYLYIKSAFGFCCLLELLFESVFSEMRLVV